MSTAAQDQTIDAVSEPSATRWFERAIASRRVRIGLALLVLLGLGLVGGAQVFDRLVERWMSQQLRDLSASYLQPELEFESLDYHAPLSVTIEGLSLRAEGVTVIEAEELTLGLAELPSRAKPLQIESIEADGLVVRIASTPGGAAGLSNFFTGAKDPKVHASDVFVLRQLTLHAGTVVWIPEQGEIMRLDAISGEVEIKRVETDGSVREYEVSLRSSQGEMVEAEVEARVNFDTLEVDLEHGELHVKVDEDTREALPPALRRLMTDHDLGGSFDAALTGYVPLREPVDGDLAMHATLRDFSLSLSDLSFPVELLTLDLHLHERVLELDSAQLEAFGGTLSINGRIGLGDEHTAPASVDWQLFGVSLQALAPGDEVAGRVRGSGKAELDLRDPSSTLRGTGDLHLRHARLKLLPGLSELARERDRGLGGHHQADASFSLRPDGVHFESLEIETPMLGFRGHGRVSFDGVLDLTMRVGPLQKVDMEGTAGEIVRAGGALLPYSVEGTITAPKVRAHLFGIGVDTSRRRR